MELQLMIANALGHLALKGQCWLKLPKLYNILISLMAAFTIFFQTAT
jgi:hypothetical protein